MKVQILAVTAILVFGGLIGNCGFNGCGPDYSDGDRVGVVWKFSRKGLLLKSYEGELNMGGFHMSGGDSPQLVPNIFAFSVEDAGVSIQVSAAAHSGKRVTLHYRQWFAHPVRLSTSYVVTGVEEVK